MKDRPLCDEQKEEMVIEAAHKLADLPFIEMCECLLEAAQQVPCKITIEFVHSGENEADINVSIEGLRGAS